MWCAKVHYSQLYFMPILLVLTYLPNIECTATTSLKQDHQNNLETDSSRDHELKLKFVSRQKRSLLQLGTEIIRSTKFSPIKLANYGNWCGRGGDRMGDGSYVDGCDLCCKKHDMCYRRTRLRYEDCNPREITYQSRYVKEEDRDYCVDEGCAQGTCLCDTKFVICLKKEPCSPLKVYNTVSYFWWLGLGKDKNSEFQSYN